VAKAPGLAALVAGTLGLDAVEEQAVALAADDVAGRDVLHLQCHLGFDAVALARRDARVTGADFSDASLAKAHEIAALCGVQIEYVQADSTDLPTALHGQFDLVYATLGLLCWIDDLDAWMASVAAALRLGGRLVLVEIHPLYACVGSLEPLQLDFPYADTGPQVFNENGSYANPHAIVASPQTIEHAHSLGEVVTAAIQAGLRITALREHLAVEGDPRGTVLVQTTGGRACGSAEPPYRSSTPSWQGLNPTAEVRTPAATTAVARRASSDRLRRGKSKEWTGTPGGEAECARSGWLHLAFGCGGRLPCDTNVILGRMMFTELDRLRSQSLPARGCRRRTT